MNYWTLKMALKTKKNYMAIVYKCMGANFREEVQSA